MRIFKQKPDPMDELRLREDERDAAERAFYEANGYAATATASLPRSRGEWAAQTMRAGLTQTGGGDDEAHATGN